MNKETEYINEDTIICNVVCNVCKNTLPPHTIKRHLNKDDKILKCPHLDENLPIQLCKRKLPPKSTDPDEYCTPNENPYATFIKIRFKAEKYNAEFMWGVIIDGDEKKGFALLKNDSIDTKHQFNDIVKYEGDGISIPEAIEVFDGDGGENAIDPFCDVVGDERIYMLINL